jgi:hypothetical protein
MMSDTTELLNELQVFIDDNVEMDGGVAYFLLQDFIMNQRGIYGGAQGECAS